VTSFAIRGYTLDDLRACLGVFDSNVPRFFRVEERAGYVTFLENLPGPYFVLVDASGAAVGCGGYAIAEGSTLADLCWGMVRREWHKRGAGRALTELRIASIREDSEVKTIALGTSQHTATFYEHLGFSTTSVEVNGYAPGLDRIDMRLELRP